MVIRPIEVNWHSSRQKLGPGSRNARPAVLAPHVFPHRARLISKSAQKKQPAEGAQKREFQLALMVSCAATHQAAYFRNSSAPRHRGCRFVSSAVLLNQFGR